MEGGKEVEGLLECHPSAVPLPPPSRREMSCDGGITLNTSQGLLDAPGNGGRQHSASAAVMRLSARTPKEGRACRCECERPSYGGMCLQYARYIKLGGRAALTAYNGTYYMPVRRGGIWWVR